MSFAFRTQAWVKEALPAVVHYDGTARAQTVTRAQEPFVYALLHAVGAHNATTKPVLMNTSLNIRGQPIANRVSDILKLFCARPQLDAVIIEHYVFDSRAYCEQELKVFKAQKDVLLVNEED